MPMIPAEKLAEWQRICEAATPGPWYTEPTGETYGGYAVESVVAATYYGPPLRVYAKSLGGTLPWADRGFIAAARNAMPELLTAYEEAAALLGQYHRALGEMLAYYRHAGDDLADGRMVNRAAEAALSADGAAAAKRLEALETVADKVTFCHDAHKAGHSLLAFAAWKEVVAAVAALEKGPPESPGAEAAPEDEGPGV